MLAITSNQKHLSFSSQREMVILILGFRILVLVLLLFSRTSQKKVTWQNYGIGLQILRHDSETWRNSWIQPHKTLGAKDTIFHLQIWSLAKKTTIIEILVVEEGSSGIAPAVVSSVGCGY